MDKETFILLYKAMVRPHLEYGNTAYCLYNKGLRDMLVSIEKSLQSMNDLDIHPRSSQLLLLNGCMAYHFLFVDYCFNVFI